MMTTPSNNNNSAGFRARPEQAREKRRRRPTRDTRRLQQWQQLQQDWADLESDDDEDGLTWWLRAGHHQTRMLSWLQDLDDGDPRVAAARDMALAMLLKVGRVIFDT